ncbi:MAG TPA: ABC-2 family transporter protein [Chloroflexota bacterium]|jgi:ABC-2 type transport system permease protein|nr:ABC-2 family transporter protein [Chloroflexota bacterium]
MTLAAIRTMLYDAKLNLMGELEYRAAFLIWIVEETLSSFISLAVWLAVLEHSTRLPLDRAQLFTYFIAQGIVRSCTMTWLIYLIPENIRDGHLSQKLLRPVPPMAHWIANNVGEKGLRLMFQVPLICVVGLFFRAELRLPGDLWTWALVVVAVLLAAAVAFLLDLLVTSMAFWLQDVWGLNGTVYFAERFLDGRLIPLALFPPWLIGVVEAQPFRYMLSFPLEILTGSLDAAAITRGFVWQIGWALALYALYRVQWHFGLRAYSAVGA